MITSHHGYSQQEPYSNNFRRTDVITVDQGSLVEVRFTSFDVEEGSKSCPYDHLTVTDGNGTVLINRICGRANGNAGYGSGDGYGYGNNSSEENGNSSTVSKDNILDITITSNTNVLLFTFVTDYSVTGSGWSADWRSVTPGLFFTFFIVLVNFNHLFRMS